MGLRATDYQEIAGYKVLDKKTLNYFDGVKNSNKFYTLELHDCGGFYRVVTDYGRIGAPNSRKQQRETDNKNRAIEEFNTIFDKKIEKGYKELDLAQSSTGSDKAKELINVNEVKVDKKQKAVKSNLKKSIQELVTQIFSEAEQQLNYFAKGNSDNSNGSPLGKLTIGQINKGRNILQDISNIINRKKNVTIQDVMDLSSEFYKYIPKTFGRKITPEMFAIRSLQEVNEQMQMLKFYEDSLRMGNVLFNHNVDEQYEKLNTEIGTLAKNTKMYKELVDYVKRSQSRHHNVNLEVKRIFTAKQKNAPAFDDSVGNVQLLFHGTRSANMPGILSTNIKLPNQLQGVYITGAMFGPGIYFADQSTKSSQYACSRFGGKVNKHNTAFLLVSEVALGRVKEERHATYHYEAPKGYDSVKGVEGPSLLHNEYIIYKENRHQIKYIIEFEAKSKRR